MEDIPMIFVAPNWPRRAWYCGGGTSRLSQPTVFQTGLPSCFKVTGFNGLAVYFQVLSDWALRKFHPSWYSLGLILCWIKLWPWMPWRVKLCPWPFSLRETCGCLFAGKGLFCSPFLHILCPNLGLWTPQKPSFKPFQYIPFANLTHKEVFLMVLT